MNGKPSKVKHLCKYCNTADRVRYSKKFHAFICPRCFIRGSIERNLSGWYEQPRERRSRRSV